MSEGLVRSERHLDQAKWIIERSMDGWMATGYAIRDLRLALTDLRIHINNTLL